MNEKYLCENCGVIFEDPIIAYAKENFDTPPYKKIKLCPCCKSSDISVSVKTCSVCGEDIFQNHIYYRIRNERRVVCDDCIDVEEE